jgi:hypothetical protein
MYSGVWSLPIRRGEQRCEAKAHNSSSPIGVGEVDAAECRFPQENGTLRDLGDFTGIGELL